VQSIGFKTYLPVGKPNIAINYLNKWGIDEIVILDIKATLNSSCKLFKNLPSFIDKCQTPVSAGGAIKCLKDIENLIRNGADKVVINSYAHNNPTIITQGAKEFGEQAIVVSVDVRKEENGYGVYIKSGSEKIDLTFSDVLKQAQDHGAGEILINSIDRDGSKQGYDLELLNYVKKLVSIPVVGCGGVGTAEHFEYGLSAKISGLAAGNFFHYTEHSVILLKSYLTQRMDGIRLDTYANYNNREFGLDKRLIPLPDNKLEELKFEYIPEEKI